MTHRVVIVGGGFGGLAAARGLRRARDIEVTLVDRRNFHLFQPLLYQVATGGLSPANIAAPLRSVLKRQRNAQTLLGEVRGIDPQKRVVLLANGKELEFDSLILATGARHHYFGHDKDWEQRAPGLKTLEDATEIRRRILSAFERAEQRAADDPQQPLTFVVVGGGPTGVEMAGAVGELARHTLRGEFRKTNPASARVILVEGQPHILAQYPEKLAAKATAALQRLGIEVRTQSTVTEVTEESVTISGNGDLENVPVDCVMWAAGVKAGSMAAHAATALDAETDRAGRLLVTDHCEIPEHSSIFAIGDMVHFSQTGEPLPGVAPVAIQQGAFVAKVIRRRLRNKSTWPFRYKDKGQMATIGRGAAVAQIGRFAFNGYLAWLAWLFVHLILLVGFQNRVLVLLQWAWNYFTRNRSARLITNRDDGASPHDAQG